MEGDTAGLHFPFLPKLISTSNERSLDSTYFDIDLITTKDDRNVLTDSLQISMPVRDIFVRDTGSHVEHDDAALTLDVVPVAQASEFLLTGRVPDVEQYRAIVGMESEWMDLDTESS